MQPRPSSLAKALILILFFYSRGVNAIGQANLSTDSLDYHPGSTVIISGSGFSPGETVLLQVTHVTGGNNETSSAHAPWYVIADQSGNINAKWLVPTDEDELGASLKLTANGTSSLVNAESFFTDAVITVTTANVSWKSLSITASDLVVIKGGGSLVVDVTDAQCASIKIAGAISDGAVGNAGAGTLIFNTGSQLTVSGTVTVGAIDGSSYIGTLNMGNGGKLICGGLVKSGFKVEVLIPGTGTIELNATSSLIKDFTTFNNLTIAAGTTSLQAATTATGLLTVMGGAVLDLFSRDFTANSLAGSGTITDSAIPGIDYNALIVGADNSSSTFSGLISDGAVQGRQRLWKKGTGTLTLPNANTYGGLTSLWAGTTEIGNNSAFGTGIAILSTNSSSATLIALGGARTINNEIWLAGTTIIGGTNDFVLNGKVTIRSGDKTLKLTNTGTTTLAGKIALSEDPTVAHRFTITGTGNVVIDGPIADCDGIGSAGSVIFDKSFTGKAIINGSNTYSKYTNLVNGTFIVSNKNVFGTGSIYLTNPSISATTELTGLNSFTNPVTNFAHPVFTGTKSIEFSERWINIALDTLTNNISEGILSITDTVDLSNSSTSYSFMFDGAGTTSITGLIENGPSTASNVIYSGTGILILGNSANKYTGSTTINAGEIRINPNTGSATFASRMVLNGGRLSTANIASNVSWASTSTLALSSNSSIDLGSNPHSLKFADSRLATWSASILTINGWTGAGGSAGTGGRIFFGNNATGLTAAQLAKIHFTGYDGPSILLSTGELVPTMLCTAPVINTAPSGQPANASISYGDNTSFSVAATGGGTLAFNWRVSKDGGSTFTNITDESFPGYAGATSNSLSLTKPTVGMSNYQYQCVITNSCGTVTSNAGVLIVNPKALTVSISAADKEYDGNTNAEVTIISPIAGIISGDDVDATALNGSFVSKTAGIGKAVTADISLTGTDAANYVFNPNASVNANIRPKPLDIQISVPSRVYDGTRNAIVQIQNPLIGVIEGDDVTAVATNGVFDNKDVGVLKRVTADVSLSGADANNYILGVSASAVADIFPLEISGSFTADDKIYDGDVTAKILARSLSGAIPEDDVSLSGGTAYFEDRNVADKKLVTLTGATLTGQASGNYSLTGVSTTTASIRQRPITIQVINKRKTYGELDLEYVCEVVPGSVVENDIPSGSVLREIGENVGEYRITQGTFTYGSNYLESFIPGSLTIDPLEVTVSAFAKTKTYADIDPAFTYTSSPAVGTVLPNKEVVAFTGQLSRVDGETVLGGPYQIERGSLSNGNYTIRYTGADLTIEPAKVTVKVDDKSKDYGAALPELTGSITGVKEFDGIGVSFTTVATEMSDVVPSGYPITANLNDPNGKLSNYTVSYLPGVLMIKKVNPIITVVGFDGEYDGSQHGAISSSAKGLNNIDLSTLLHLESSTYKNVPGGTLHWDFEGNGNYNSMSGEVTVRIKKADAVIQVQGYDVTYDGNRHVAAAKALGVESPAADLSGLLDLSGTAHTDAGDYELDDWIFAGNENYNAAKGTVHSTISKAASTVTVAVNDLIYDGDRHPASASVMGSVEVVQPLPITYSGIGTTNYGPSNEAPINAGQYSASTVYAGDDNHTGSSDSKTFTIGKANAVISVNPYKVTYDGTEHTAAFTAVGVESSPVDLASLMDVTNTKHTGAGDYTKDTWSFAGNDNYNAVSATPIADKIDKASSTTVVTIVGGPFPYTGSEIAPATVSVTGANLSLAPAAEYANNVNAGTAMASYSYAGDDNHTGSSDSKTFTIGKAPTMTAVTIVGGPFRYSGSEITPAIVSVTGADLSLAPAAEYANNVNAGTAMASYSYAGDDNHTGSSDSKTFTIGKANAVISVTPYNVTYDGTEHTAAFTAVGVESTPVDLASLMDVTNTKHIGAGDYTKDTWSFAGNDNYNAVSATTIEDKIDKASSTTVVTIVGGPFRYSGSEITPATVSVTGANLSLAPAADYANNMNAGTATASYSYAGDDNHTGSSDSKAFTIGKKQLLVTAQNKEKVYDGLNYVDGGGIFSATITGFAASESLETSGVSGFPAYEGPAITAIHYGSHLITPTIGTLQADNYSFSFVDGTLQINKRVVDITGSKVYDGNSMFAASDLIARNVIGGEVVNLEGSATVSNNSVGNYTSLATNFLGCSNPDYQATGGSIDLDITQRPLKVTATGIDKMYDGSTDASVNLTSDKIPVDDVNLSYGGASYADPGVGTHDVNAKGITIGGVEASNYVLVNNTCSTSAKITKAWTTTALRTSASVVRYMDQLTLTANITPANKGSELTGTVQFKIGSVLFGTPVTVVRIPGDPGGAVQATFIGQVTNLPTASYTIEAVFTSTNANYSNSSDTEPLQVNPRNADPYNVNLGFYTGDIFAWTTGQNSSTGTVKLSTTIFDKNESKGDVRAARVTFYMVNSGGMTPIAGATNLPVGLVDVTDGSVGTASAIVQLNIGANNAQSYTVAVGVAGAYYNVASSASAQSIVTVSKPVSGGYMVCGGSTQNTNSAGYIKGDLKSMTNFEADILYTKSGTNPKGKATVLIGSYYKSNGSLDTKQHTYVINTNAIASLNVAAGSPATATFSSKANLYEQLEDMSLMLVEGGAVFEMVVKQGCEEQVAITLYRKSGGIWFSSNWDGTRTIPQVLYRGEASVAGAAPCLRITSSNGVVKEQIPDVMVKPLARDVTVYPNPATSQFNVTLVSSNTRDAMSIAVYDMHGKVIEQKRNLTTGQTIQIGEFYRPGVYILEIIQDKERRRLKLIKIPD